MSIDEEIEIVKALIKKATAKSGATRPVYISFDEWSAGGPGGGSTLAEALMVAQHLNSFNRHAGVQNGPSLCCRAWWETLRKAEAVNSSNTRTREAVATTKEIQFQDNTISYSFPEHSFTQMLIPVK